MGPGELGLGPRLCLNTLKVWLCLGLGLGRDWPGLGERLSGLCSVLSLVLLLRWVSRLLLGLGLMPGLQVRLRLGCGPGLGLRLGCGPGLGLRLCLGWGPGLGLRLRLGWGSGLGLSLKLGWGPGLRLELRLQ